MSFYQRLNIRAFCRCVKAAVKENDKTKQANNTVLEQSLAEVMEDMQFTHLLVQHVYKVSNGIETNCVDTLDVADNTRMHVCDSSFILVNEVNYNDII